MQAFQQELRNDEPRSQWKSRECAQDTNGEDIDVFVVRRQCDPADLTALSFRMMEYASHKRIIGKTLITIHPSSVEIARCGEQETGI